LMLGNGSDELIQLLCLALGARRSALLSPEPGFSMYRVIAQWLQLPFVGVDLAGEDFDLPLAQMLACIRQHRPGAVFLACPNNPTGNLFSPQAVESVIAAAPGLVVIDEAYEPVGFRNWKSCACLTTST